jgi:hypothetical protein
MAGVIAGLALLISACEKDISDGRGAMVPILFSTSTAGYDADEGMRGFKRMAPETQVIPLGDGLFMYATLQEDTIREAASDEPRAAIFNNQKIRFAAFNKSTGVQIGSTVTYRHNGTRLVPEGDPVGVEPDGTTMYRFVAYSYYGDYEEDPVETGIAPSQDLVWGDCETTIVDTETSRTVPITMRHKFSRVKVKINASAIATAITAISNVQVFGEQTVIRKTKSANWMRHKFENPSYRAYLLSVPSSDEYPTETLRTARCLPSIPPACSGIRA